MPELGDADLLERVSSQQYHQWDVVVASLLSTEALVSVVLTGN